MGKRFKSGDSFLNDMKYLIIEDDDAIAEGMQERLEDAELGLEVKISIYPDEGLMEWNRVNTPEIVQLDGLNGNCFDLYDMLVLDNPNARYFVYSSKGGFEAEANQRGMGFILKKRGSGDKVLEYVRELLRE